MADEERNEQVNPILAIALLATIPLRNPFWPIGYTGEREAIVDDPHIKVATASEETADEDTKTSVTAEAIAAAEAEAADSGQGLDRLWIKARKALKIGSTLKAGGADGRQAVTINGKIYADGDLISFNHNGYRFTWRVKQLTSNNTLKLLRIKARELETETEEKGSRK